MHNGVAVDEETLALDAVKEVGPGGSFRMSMHTMKRFRQTQCYLASFVDHNKRDVWEAKGRLSFAAAAAAAAQQMLAAPNQQLLAGAKAQALDQIIKDINGEVGCQLPLV